MTWVNSAGCDSVRFGRRTEIKMAWTEFAQKPYARASPRFSTDVTDAEWSMVGPLSPGPNPLGRPREVELRVRSAGIRL